MGNNSLQTAGQLLENYLSRDCTCENFSLQSILDRLEEMDLKNHTDLVASELGGATLFASLFKGEICYDPDTRTLYRFSQGKPWLQCWRLPSILMQPRFGLNRQAIFTNWPVSGLTTALE